MADVIIVRRNCSLCDATEDSETNEFENIHEATIAINAEEPVLLHVCKKCRKNVFDGLLALGERKVTKPAKPKKAKKAVAPVEGEFKCRHCDRTFAKSQGRGRHEAAIHPGEVHLKVTSATKAKAG